MMKYRKFFRTTHKWGGILLSVVLLNTAVTGFLLLIKKKYSWIQPPTREGKVGGTEDFISTRHLLEIVFRQGHEDLQRLEDIDRIDFRPDKRVFKVRSRHNHSEIQVDAVSGAVLSVAWRPSDLLESLHDGSFFGAIIHDYLMPVTAFMLLFLTASGLYLWIAPLTNKSRRQFSIE